MGCSHIITNPDELREIIGDPRPINLTKIIHTLNNAVRKFIASSPFCLIASYNREQDYLDVSPKGDAPGFVQTIDDTTLIIPERPGNKLAFTLHNLLTNNLVSIIFLIPGKKETLRIRGRADILIDHQLAQAFAVQGKAPKLLLQITVQDCYFHCAKCIIRSRLWQPESWLDTQHLPTWAEVLAQTSQQEAAFDTINQAVEQNYKDQLY